MKIIVNVAIIVCLISITSSSYSMDAEKALLLAATGQGFQTHSTNENKSLLDSLKQKFSYGATADARLESRSPESPINALIESDSRDEARQINCWNRKKAACVVLACGVIVAMLAGLTVFELSGNGKLNDGSDNDGSDSGRRCFTPLSTGGVICNDDNYYP